MAKPVIKGYKTTDSVHSPKTRRKASEISPTVAYAPTIMQLHMSHSVSLARLHP
jgi:hypothetical protein